ncbi:MAG TPA: hypothetical protein VIN40_07905 [Candidatus Tyrphobacter sp.]
MLEGIELATQQILRVAAVRAAANTVTADGVNALRNEVATALDLCQSSNAMSQSPPYVGWRSTITGSVQLAENVSSAPQFQGDFDLAALNACAQRLGLASR